MAATNPLPNVAPMHDILQDALDALSSPRISTTAKGDALVAIEHVLAETADPRATGLPGYFNALQDTFQCNVASRIIAWTAETSPMLDNALKKHPANPEDNAAVATLSAQLTLAMTIIQGVALVHKSSKQFLGRSYPLEVLLDLFLVSRHLSHSPTGPSVPTSPKSGVFSAPVYKSEEVPLASVVLDTLLCVLVDAVPALRTFEELNGVQVVVKILKRSGTPREVRMKCLEFIYFYLMDETTTPEAVGETAESLQELGVSVPSQTHRKSSSISTSSNSGFTTRPSSRSSSGSSAFSALSTSTTATSASLHGPPIATKPDAENEPIDPSSRTKTVIPSSRPVTPPPGGRVQPRSLLMLKKEVDYVPLSPRKPQLSHLGRTPSGLRPKAPAERSTPSHAHPATPIPPSRLQLRGSRDRLSSPVDKETPEPRKATPRTPRPRLSLANSHSRGLSTSSISSLSSVGSSMSSAETEPLPPLPSLLASRRATPAPSRGLSASSNAPDTPKSSLGPSKTPLHRRTQSLADFAPSDSTASSSLSPVLSHSARVDGVGPRSASSPTTGAAVCATEGKRGPRTTAEKKEILGTMLGNVDALVEGVKKAGVWGLS
ncbi:cell division control protein 14, SIN component-domain-containing protein [Epithele typhae]|uniref:cell division control protein 14, SIN component-domain-containing protein n=1 Tax=Epithele typhae TaxID=378194 RepID=UPI002008E062|nr:cell division control protein 14, SIN component-domain-containing protein [Epithele typhae]KAH9939362.1 cell division control protein 14, SIN component-domain-containing protein [Epithele typhae]